MFSAAGPVLSDVGGDPEQGGARRIESSDPAAEARVARLTPAQLDCLRLVNQHLNSKEIAVRLGISPHTVDQRIRQSLQILGVERRAQAARLVAEHGEPYQRLIHQAPYIPGPGETGQPEAAVSHQIRHADRAGEAGGKSFLTEQRAVSFWYSLQPPFAT